MKGYWLALGASLVFTQMVSAQVPQTWNAAQLEELLPPVGLSADDQYGQFVAVSGEWAVVGSWLDDWSGPNSGAAYVFRRTGNAWTYFTLLLPQPGTTSNVHGPHDYFGHGVDIDGSTIVIGEYGDDQVAGDSGAAFVFAWNGLNWVQEAVLKAGNAAASDVFGYDVAIEGDLIVCGAPGRDLPSQSNAGSAFVFARLAPGVWCEQFELSSLNLAAGDEFGAGVAVNDEPGMTEDRIAVGAYLNDEPGAVDTGAAYVFWRNDNGTADPCDDLWIQYGVQPILNPGFAAGERFGWKLDLEADSLLVGAPYDDASGATDCGSISFFERQGSSWVLNIQRFPSQPQHFTYSGYELCLDGDTAVVGLHGFDNSISTNGGAAVVYTRSATSWVERLRFHHGDSTTDDFAGLGVGLEGDTVIYGAHASNQGGSNSGSAYAFRIARDQFRSFCEGSSGCPCANNSNLGSAQGCRNSLGRGALLQPSGSTSVAVDDLLLFASNIPPSVSCILFGSLTTTSTPFYAGLRCVNVPTVRLGLTSSSNTTHVAWNPPVQWLSGGPGAVWYLQAWYRDPTFVCAGSPFATTNLTAGVEVQLTP